MPLNLLSLRIPRYPYLRYDIYRATKRLMDIVIGSVLLILFIAITPFISLLIKSDSPGPVFFRQVRVGEKGKTFHVWKFRTMHTQHCDTKGGKQATKNDPRITRIGAWLRRWSIDELPQILNILHGEMSLVGPRPHAVEHDKFYAQQIDLYWVRYTVKPGLTGLAQIRGCRGETATTDQMQDRIHYDLEYIRNMSLVLDLLMLLATAKTVFLKQNAY